MGSDPIYFPLRCFIAESSIRVLQHRLAELAVVRLVLRIRTGAALHADRYGAGADGGGDVAVAVAVVVLNLALGDERGLVLELRRDDRVRQLHVEEALVARL